MAVPGTTLPRERSSRVSEGTLEPPGFAYVIGPGREDRGAADRNGGKKGESEDSPFCSIHGAERGT